MLQKQCQLDKYTSSFRIGIDSILLLEYSDSTENTVFKKESPSPVEVEPGDLYLLKYGKRKKKQPITGNEIEKKKGDGETCRVDTCWNLNNCHINLHATCNIQHSLDDI
ncbi:hypothetical protein AABB24_010321 [Solanum stoloniferum]|uniref:Uncharacterized protein n=1 Tax=Solanum stoloniferum TaxID=62892 RepID=A0ABD2U9B9_9SOLN